MATWHKSMINENVREQQSARKRRRLSKPSNQLALSHGLFARAFSRIALYSRQYYPGRYDILRSIIGDVPTQTIARWQNTTGNIPVSILALLIDYFKKRIEGDHAIIRELELEIARQKVEGAHNHPWQIARRALVAKKSQS